MKLCLHLLIFLVVINNAQSAILYTQFPIDNNPDAWTSNFSNNLESLNQTADQFSLVSTTTIREIAWHGKMTKGPNNAPETFLIRVFEDDEGLPAASHLASIPVVATLEVTSTTASGSSGTVFLYTATVEIPLQGGNYWISVLKSYPSLDQTSIWVWLESHLGFFQGGLAQRQFGETDDWSFANAGERSFEIRDTVTIPEPSSALLSSLALLFLFRRSRT